MKSKTIKKPDDLIKKRKSRRGFVLVVKKIKKIKKPAREKARNLAVAKKTVNPLIRNGIIKKSIAKILALLLIFGLNWSGLSAIGQTFAYFQDTETSENNVYQAGTLDISLDPAGIYVSGLMYPTDTTTTSIILSNNGSLATQHASKITLLTPVTPDDGACDYVNLDAASETQSYSGPLLNFISSATALNNSVNWTYTFTIDSSTPPSVWNKTCYFKWIFTAWSKDVAEPNGGFVDIEEKSGGIRIGKTIALNEILANPVGFDNALKPNGEWVELYNNSNVDINVNGWVVYDFYDDHELYITTSNTDTGNTIVPAHGFLVVYRDGDGDFTINNSNETIRLYTGYPVSSSILVDSYSYTMEKPEGFSYARIPDGIGDWADPIPTPGRMNVLEGPQTNEIIPTEIKEAATIPEETPVIKETSATTPEIVEETAAISETNMEGIPVEENIAPESETQATSTPAIEEINVPVIEEWPITEEHPAIEENPTQEISAAEEEPAIVEEQPATVEEPVTVEQLVPPPVNPSAPTE